MIRKGIIVLLVFAVVFIIALVVKRAVHKQNAQKPTSVFVEQKKIDLGSLYFGEQKNVLFNLKNVGPNKLFIKKISASCGCTVPVMPESVIDTKSTCELTIRFVAENAGTGFFNKNIFVFTNDTARSPHKLTLTGKVLPGTNYSR